MASLTRKAKERVKERAEEEGVITVEVDTMVTTTKVTKILVTTHHPDSQEGAIIIQVVKGVRDIINLLIMQTRINKVAIMAKGDIMATISSSRIGSRTVLIKEAQTI